MLYTLLFYFICICIEMHSAISLLNDYVCVNSRSSVQHFFAVKFVLFSVSSLRDKSLLKKQTYTKTETCKFYSRVFWTFQPNVIQIDPYNFELYCFKVGAFFETQCSSFVQHFLL